MIETSPLRPRLVWDTHTALAVLIVGTLIGLAVLRTSLSSGGAIQP
jgi:hypothetical protein